MKIMKKIILFFVFLLFIPFTTVHASSDVYVEDTYGKLTSEEVTELQNYAKEISDTYQFGVYARIIEDTTGSSYNNMDEYSERYYSQENLGYGDTSDGVLLLITFSEEGGTYQVMIPSSSDQKMFSLDGLDLMDNAAYSSLKNQDFYQAIFGYIERADSLMSYYESHGVAYGSNYGYELTVQDSTNIKYASVFGIPPIVALLTVLGLKKKHKTKYTATTATNYVPQNGLHLTNKRDMFLYQTVTRVPLPHDDGDHGGGRGMSPGGSHFSSGGGMHSGGGHF